jgi:cupin fold WbuC family metalloprotein
MSAKRLTFEMLDNLIYEAQQSPRHRLHLNLHNNYSENVQRLLNAIGTESYIRPHRHLFDPKPELLVAVSGVMSLLVFNFDGEIENITRFGCNRGTINCFAVEVSPATWHTVIAETPDAVILEIKPGPFNPDSAKEYAPWAPDENSPAARAYFAGLRDKLAK